MTWTLLFLQTSTYSTYSTFSSSRTLSLVCACWYVLYLGYTVGSGQIMQAKLDGCMDAWSEMEWTGYSRDRGMDWISAIAVLFDVSVAMWLLVRVVGSR